MGNTVSSPNRVWGRAAAEIEFGVLYPYNIFGGSNFHKSKAPLGARSKVGPRSPPPKAGTAKFTKTHDRRAQFLLLQDSCSS